MNCWKSRFCRYVAPTFLTDSWQNMSPTTTQLPVTFTKLTNLTRLIVAYNMFQSFPAEISSLPLVFLDTHNSFAAQFDLPDEIANTKELKVWHWGTIIAAWVSSRDQCCISVRFALAALLDDFGRAARHLETKVHAVLIRLSLMPPPIQIWRLGNNNLVELPECFADMDQMECLDLSGNQLKKVQCENPAANLSRRPLSAYSLVMLATDKAYSTRSESVLLTCALVRTVACAPSSVRGVRPCLISSHISPRCKQSPQLPGSFGKMQRLRELLLHGNPLSEFPAVVCELSGLRVLNVSNCGGDIVLPDELGKMTSLTRFRADCCSLPAIPSSMGKCTQLEHLTMRSNRLTQVSRCPSPLPFALVLCMSHGLQVSRFRRSRVALFTQLQAFEMPEPRDFQ